MSLTKLRAEEARITSIVQETLDDYIEIERGFDRLGVVTSNPEVRKRYKLNPVEEEKPKSKEEIRELAVRHLYPALELTEILGQVHAIKGDTSSLYKLEGDNNPVIHFFVVGSEQGKANVLEAMLKVPGIEVIENNDTEFFNHNGNQYVLKTNNYVINVFIPKTESSEVFEMLTESNLSDNSGSVPWTTISRKDGVMYNGRPNMSTASEYSDHARNLRGVARERYSLEIEGKTPQISSKETLRRALDKAIQGYKINASECQEQVVYCAAGYDSKKYTRELLIDSAKIVAVYDSDNMLNEFRRMLKDPSERGFEGYEMLFEITLDNMFANIPKGSDLHNEVAAQVERTSVSIADAVHVVRARYESMIPR